MLPFASDYCIHHEEPVQPEGGFESVEVKLWNNFSLSIINLQTRRLVRFNRINHISYGCDGKQLMDNIECSAVKMAHVGPHSMREGLISRPVASKQRDFMTCCCARIVK